MAVEHIGKVARLSNADKLLEGEHRVNGLHLVKNDPAGGTLRVRVGGATGTIIIDDTIPTGIETLRYTWPEPQDLRDLHLVTVMLGEPPHLVVFLC